MKAQPHGVFKHVGNITTYWAFDLFNKEQAEKEGFILLAESSTKGKALAMVDSLYKYGTK